MVRYLRKGTCLLGVVGLIATLHGTPLTFANLNPNAAGLEEVLVGLTSPKSIESFLQKNFQYIEDNALFETVDYWQEPSQFLSRGMGDCEDFALFSKLALERLGFEASVVSVYGPDGYAHTVTVFEDASGLHVMNEDRLYLYRARSIEDALSRISPFWIWASIAERRGERGWPLNDFTNPNIKK
jgi:hypothetical protein